MTISVMSNGYTQSVSSVQGWEDLYHFVKKQGHSALLTFMQHGEGQRTEDLVKDIDKILPVTTDQNIKSTLEGLKEALSKCRGWAVVSE